ncbi:MAG: GDSL-type esterase/lipase family protein [Candidatus Deferrimicrobiaceae bacterium]
MSALTDMRHALSATRPRFLRLSLTAIFAALALIFAALAFHPVAFAGGPHQGDDKYGFGGYGGGGEHHGDRDGDKHWVGTWATSPQATNAITFNNQTLRMIVRVSLGGKKVRVRFSNAYGTVPLVIDAAHIALRAPCSLIYDGYKYIPPCPTCSPPITVATQPPPPGGTCSTVDGSAIVPGSDRVLTFGGSPSTKVFPGAVMVSDPVDLNVPALADLAVSFYLPNSVDTTLGNLITRHGTAKQTSYISAPSAGDLTAATMMPGGTTITTSWYFLNTVEVLASEQTGAIVALGDSLTDANVSTQDMNFRWPYELARRLNAKYSKNPMGVLDHGTGGDKVTWDSVTPPLGGNDSGQHRFDRDVIAAPGVTHVIVLLGVNDLRNSPSDNAALVVTADEVISGYKQMILRAHSAGIKIYGGTLIPWWQGIFTGDNWTLVKWQKREDINKWIRTSGAFDAVVDFDKCLADPSDPKNMLPIYDSGDHLHGSDLGYNQMGKCIDLSLFKDGKDHD